MDISKLPKLSKSREQTGENPVENEPLPEATLATPPSLAYARTVPKGIGGEVWFNSIVGILCLYMGKMFGSYLFARATGHPFHTNVSWVDGDQAGQEVPYSQLAGHQMLTDAGVFLFGLAILLEVVVKATYDLRGRVPRFLVIFTLALAILTACINLFSCAKQMSDGVLPIISGLAAAFGGYIVVDIFRIFKTIRPTQSTEPVQQ